MPGVLTLILLVLGFVLFLIAAVGVGSGRFNLVAAGLACWILTQILAAFPAA